MTRSANCICWFGWTLVAVAAPGCGGAYDATVAGKVTLDGAVVPRGTITFLPQGNGPPAYGRIESDGSYSLRTGREEGVQSGSYHVTVAANEPSVERGKDGGPPPVGKPITPEWYRNPAHSGLTFIVAPGNNAIDLNLTSAPPPGWKTKRRPS